MPAVTGPTCEFDAAQQSFQASHPSGLERTGYHGCSHIPVHAPPGRSLRVQTALCRIQEEHKSRKNKATYNTHNNLSTITQRPE